MEFRLFYNALKDLDLLWKWNGREELTRDGPKTRKVNVEAKKETHAQCA
jgi:hypothetical protein